MTLLTAVRAACAECNQPQPTAVVTSSDVTAQQMLALANAIGDELQRDFDWQKLIREATFSAIASADQGLITTLASDYDRFVNDTLFNRSRHWRIRGPVSSQEWQQLLARGVTGIDRLCYVRQGHLYMTPSPTAGDSIYFEYAITKWCESSGGTGQTSFLADTDVFRLNERLLTMALVYRFREAKGLQHLEHLARYEKYLKGCLLQDGGRQKLSMAGPLRLFGPNIPEGSWNV